MEHREYGSVKADYEPSTMGLRALRGVSVLILYIRRG